MSDKAQQRALDKVVHAALMEQVGAQRYRQRQRQARSGGAVRPHPLTSNAGGFPTALAPSNRLQRAARRANPF
jgi:hypothetical protein